MAVDDLWLTLRVLPCSKKIFFWLNLTTSLDRGFKIFFHQITLLLSCGDGID